MKETDGTIRKTLRNHLYSPKPTEGRFSRSAQRLFTDVSKLVTDDVRSLMSLSYFVIVVGGGKHIGLKSEVNGSTKAKDNYCNTSFEEFSCKDKGDDGCV